jgi:2'-deoxynucleoside 5'-phosphate N-hydrolase
MKIYLACTVRGDRGAIAGLRSLVSALEADGHTILTKHLLDDDVEGAESALTELAVYERDIMWLESCDVLVADASGSSFGVGFEWATCWDDRIAPISAWCCSIAPTAAIGSRG